MEAGLQSATLIRRKKNAGKWTAVLPDKTKVELPMSELKILESGNMRDIGPAEPWPKPERQKEVLLRLDTTKPEPVVLEWALAS
jgi:hypothetical protein